MGHSSDERTSQHEQVDKTMQIVEVRTPTHIKEFLKIHRTLYKDDPHFISHIDQDVEKVFDINKNTFFRHGEAIRWILQDNTGKTIGRVAAFIDQQVAHSFDQPTGGMGFFECINDCHAAFLLFDTCKKWLEAKGMEAMEGPVNFGEKDKYWGLITENFDAPPYYQQNYNPEYYKVFFEKYGFKIYYEQLIFYCDLTVPLQDKFQIRMQRLKKNPKYYFCSIDPKQLDKFAEDFRTIYNRAWASSHSNFAEMNKAEARMAIRAMKPIMDADLVYFAYYEERPIGFYIGIPNVNEIFKYVNGNLNWFGKLKFLYYRWRGERTAFIGIAFGVDPDFQGRGIEGALFQLCHDLIIMPRKYRHLYIAWIGDFNPKMIRIIEGLGTDLFRKMATYIKLFDDSKPFKRRAINKSA